MQKNNSFFFIFSLFNVIRFLSKSTSCHFKFFILLKRMPAYKAKLKLIMPIRKVEPEDKVELVELANKYLVRF